MAKTLIFIHPYDAFGHRFKAVPYKRLDSLVGWTMLACVMCIPTLWDLIASSITSNRDWQGWLLSIAWDSISTRCVKQSKYFPVSKKMPRRIGGDPCIWNQERLQIKLCLDNYDKNNNIKYHSLIWRSFESVLMKEGVLSNDSIPLCKSTIILLHSDIVHTDHHLVTETDTWELRLVILEQRLPNNNLDYVIYTRHGGSIGPLWWVQYGKKSKYFYKSTGLPTNANSTFILCVYVRKVIQSTLDLRNKYLKCMGGQHKVYCTRHKTPLILHPAKRQRQSTTTQPSNPEDDQIIKMLLQERFILLS